MEVHWTTLEDLSFLVRAYPSQASAEGCLVPPVLGDLLLKFPLPQPPVLSFSFQASGSLFSEHFSSFLPSRWETPRP